IGMSVLSKQPQTDDDKTSSVPATSWRLKLPLKGVLFGCGAGIGQGVGLVLSKMGLQHYHAAILAQGLTPDSIPVEAVLSIPLSLSLPFAATMIRAIMGIVGFSVALLLFTKGGSRQLNRAVHDRKAMLCTLGSGIFGPFIGVSLSLLATLYTSTGIAQTLMALTPIFIIAPAAWLFRQKVTPREVVGALISVAGVSLFFL
ncbi:MAG: DMT family transporter, partial [Bacteroidales bacterium]|nr:DMT family transporter [Bacteroidales bacterium]